MSNYVEDGFTVVNVDNGKLNELRRTSNTLDCGALKILESLDLFCEDLIDNCECTNQTSYRKLFDSLRTLIKSAYENEKLRNAVMTGIIQDTPKSEIKAVKTVESKSGVRERDLNKDEVTAYSKDHTISESAEHFEISRSQMKTYIAWHHIPFVPEKSGRKSVINKEQVLKVSKDLTVKELAALFRVSNETMAKYCQRNHIPHKAVYESKKQEDC